MTTRQTENQKTEEPKKRTLTEEKLAYRPHNTAFSLESVAPAAMVEAMDRVLAEIEKKEGSIDEFVTRELGYDTIEDAHNALAAEQMDSVAMAIYQMKQGQAMIIKKGVWHWCPMPIDHDTAMLCGLCHDLLKYDDLVIRDFADGTIIEVDM